MLFERRAFQSVEDSSRAVPCEPATSLGEDIAIAVRNLGKCYRLWDRPADRLRQPLASALSLWLPIAGKQYFREFWALKNVGLDVKKGETVGIVGRNGAGKSTLLQVLCGTTKPSTGTLSVNGRASALLELGAGFHPEFTGMENVYTSGAIMGISKAEMEEKYESIVAFADIGEFINQPVKSYSTGMFMRLAFAVSACSNPDILIIDEALAVGDEVFQRKCFSFIEDLQEKGKTVLLVTHSMSAVMQLCNRAVWLDCGELVLDSSPKLVMTKYQQFLFAPPEKRAAIRAEIRDLMPGEIQTQAEAPEDARKAGLLTREAGPKAFHDPSLVPASRVEYLTRGARISAPRIMTLGREVVNHLIARNEYIYCYTAEFFEEAHLVRFGMSIKTLTGLALAGGCYPGLGEKIPVVEANTRAEVRWRFRCLFAPGTYVTNAAIFGAVNDDDSYLHRIIDAAMFKVQPYPKQIASCFVDVLSDGPVEVEFLSKGDGSKGSRCMHNETSGGV
jgi:lipopolysaccharide transport system ATP-binding protein